MYEAFFKLETSPFVLTPDPRFLFRAKGHHAILASLLESIASQKGLMALIGDVGTGKTTLCRALLQELPKEVECALVLNPVLSEAELIAAILADLGVEPPRGTRGELLRALTSYLLAAGADGKAVLVILDEAQRMSVEALEQIRTLSNLESGSVKLLQILLVGQPELEERLRQPELRQLDQRVAIRCYLEPLSRKEVFRYIEHRLRVAGLMDGLPFTPDAMHAIHRWSRGVPRLINLLCDRALTIACGAQSAKVTTPLVKAAIRHLEGARRRRRARRLRAALATGTLAAVLVGTVSLAYWSGWPYVKAPSLRVPRSMAIPEAPVERGPAAPRLADAGTREGAQAVEAAGSEAWHRLIARLLRLWGVGDELTREQIASWPNGPDGTPEIAAVAARYQLAVALLSKTSLAELRAIGLPALLEVGDSTGKRPFLLRRIRGDGVVLLAPSGDEVRHTPESLERLWDGTARVLWRNVDDLPSDPSQEMTPPVLTTVALRLYKLGHLAPPLPTGYSERLESAVRDFQREVGLPEDGVVGPKTTLALSRVVGGRFNPTIVER